MTAGARTRRLVVVALACAGIALFLGLRVAYWSSVTEEPFSDMADYNEIAKHVADRGSFAWDSFWQSYRPPTLPALRALVMLVFGEEDLDAWRLFRAALVLAAVLWLCRELALATGRAWPWLVLLLVVALSKSSIFWSLKVATEGVAEAFVYAISAASLWVLRAGTLRACLGLGALHTLALLNRPNFAALLPLGMLVALLARSSSSRIRRVAVFAAGVVLVWSPWLVRSYVLYGQVVPIATHAPFTFWIDLENAQVRQEDGTWRTVDMWGLLAEARAKCANDAEASRYAGALVRSWLSDNVHVYLRKLGDRALHSLATRQIDLSRVPRDELFGSWLDHVLIDKSLRLLAAGWVGTFLLAVLVNKAFLIPLGVSVVAWGASALFIGEPRLAKPMLPVWLFGNAGWCHACWLAANRWLRGRRS